MHKNIQSYCVASEVLLIGDLHVIFFSHFPSSNNMPALFLSLLMSTLAVAGCVFQKHQLSKGIIYFICERDNSMTVLTNQDTLKIYLQRVCKLTIKAQGLGGGL